VSLLSDICPEQGLTTESSSVRLLVQTLVGMSQAERSEFLLFTTCCPHLPPGGMAGLQPRFKVHPKVVDQGSAGSSAGRARPALPSASTCLHVLKLPSYRNQEEMRQSLLTAMRDSRGLIDMS
jgi:hypothetical protein